MWVHFSCFGANRWYCETLPSGCTGRPGRPILMCMLLIKLLEIGSANTAWGLMTFTRTCTHSTAMCSSTEQQHQEKSVRGIKREQWPVNTTSKIFSFWGFCCCFLFSAPLVILSCIKAAEMESGIPEVWMKMFHTVIVECSLNLIWIMNLLQ